MQVKTPDTRHPMRRLSAALGLSPTAYGRCVGLAQSTVSRRLTNAVDTPNEARVLQLALALLADGGHRDAVRKAMQRACGAAGMPVDDWDKLRADAAEDAKNGATGPEGA